MFWDEILLSFFLAGFTGRAPWEIFWQICRSDNKLGPGLPDFSRYKIPKRTKLYQKALKYTIWPWSRQDGPKNTQHLPLQDLPKFTQIRIFGLKIYHLATLVETFSPPPPRRHRSRAENNVTDCFSCLLHLSNFFSSQKQRLGNSCQDGTWKSVKCIEGECTYSLKQAIFLGC
jgi:hypothetical protein